MNFINCFHTIINKKYLSPGWPISSTIAEAKAYFGDKVDFYVDGGTITNNQPSTIIGLDEHANIVIFRRGAVDIDRLFTK